MLPVEDETSVKIDQLLGRLVDQGAFNGSALIAKNGQVLLNKGYGLEDSDKSLPNTPHTKFRIASLTKQFTAMAVLILQAQGKLNVQDRACRYLPDCPPSWEKITIRHLLMQTSGIPDLTRFADFDDTYRTLDTPDKIVAYFRDKPLDFQPGKGWAYSNSGYILLGYLIEKISGRSYKNFLQEEIFSPLGMQDSGSDQNLDHLAVGYTTPGVQAGSMDLTWLFSAGSLYSTVEDLYRWDQALYTGRLVPQALLAEMFMPQAAVPAGNSFSRFGDSYGYGWAIGTQLGRRAEVHAGAINGYSSLIERYPDDRVTIILLSNLDGKEYTSTALQIAGMIFEQTSGSTSDLLKSGN